MIQDKYCAQRVLPTTHTDDLVFRVDGMNYVRRIDLSEAPIGSPRDDSSP